MNNNKTAVARLKIRTYDGHDKRSISFHFSLAIANLSRLLVYCLFDNRELGGVTFFFFFFFLGGGGG